MGRKGEKLSASRMIHHFLNRGEGGTNSGPFADLDASVRQRLLASAVLDRCETPALASFAGEENWTLITSERVVWCRAGEGHAVGIGELTGVTIAEGHLAETRDKRWLTDLAITTSDGAAFVLSFESGLPFFGFWNVLKLLAK